VKIPVKLSRVPTASTASHVLFECSAARNALLGWVKTSKVPQRPRNQETMMNGVTFELMSTTSAAW
jgi:hypothetical protein